MKKIILLVLLSLVSLLIGTANINVFNLSSDDFQVLVVSRLPRLISIILAASAFSLSGLIMQNLTRNKFVSPTTSGTVEFSKLGILLCLLFFNDSSIFLKVLISFIVSIIGTFIFLSIINKVRFEDKSMVALIGIILGSVVASITTLIAYRFDLIQNITSWAQGNFSLVVLGNYELLYLSIPLLVITYLYASKFMIAGLGQDIATNLGLNYHQIRNLGLIIVALLSSLVVLSVGSLPFLGLIIPNLVAMKNGDNFKNNINDTIIYGIYLVLIADIISRVIIYPYEIPISLILGIVGSIIFLFLIFKGEKHEN